MTATYGMSDAEKTVKENSVCHEIAREVSLFGINDRQRLYLIYLLALELEKAEQVQAFGDLARELGSDAFLSLQGT